MNEGWRGRNGLRACGCSQCINKGGWMAGIAVSSFLFNNQLHLSCNLPNRPPKPKWLGISSKGVSERAKPIGKQAKRHLGLVHFFQATALCAYPWKKNMTNTSRCTNQSSFCHYIGIGSPSTNPSIISFFASALRDIFTSAYDSKCALCRHSCAFHCPCYRFRKLSARPCHCEGLNMQRRGGRAVES